MTVEDGAAIFAVLAVFAVVTIDAVFSVFAVFSVVTIDAVFAVFAVVTIDAVFSVFSVVAIDAVFAWFTLGTLVAVFARRAGVALVAFRTSGPGIALGAAFGGHAENALLVGTGYLNAFLAFFAFQALAGEADDAFFGAGLLDAEGQRFDRGSGRTCARGCHQGEQTEANRDHSRLY